MKKAVESEDEKQQSKQNPSGYGCDLHNCVGCPLHVEFYSLSHRADSKVFGRKIQESEFTGIRMARPLTVEVSVIVERLVVVLLDVAAGEVLFEML